MTRYPGIGGIENVTTIIIKELLYRGGYIIDIISHCQQNNELTEINIKNRIHIFRMPDMGKYYTKENFSYAENIIKYGSYDAIIYQDSYAPTECIVSKLSDKYNIPLFVFEHNTPLFVIKKRALDSLFSIKGFLRRFLHPLLIRLERKRKRYLLDHSHKYILLSSNYVKEFSKLIELKSPCDKITYINNPIELHGKSLGEPEKENIILCVCQLNKVKGVDKMLMIWQIIAKQLPDWKFVVVGDGNEKDILIKQAKNIPRTEFVGYAKPDSYYKKSKIFMMMSQFEGWGMTIVESMHYGCVPVVYDSFSALADIIDNSINGFIIPNNDISEYEAAIITLARNEDIRKKMSLSAILKSKQFDVKFIVDKWEKILKN